MASDLRLGILGGGQLARMLAEAAEACDISVRVYVESSRDPAAQVVDQFIKGSLTNEAELRRFFETVDVVTFENEFVDCDLLQRISDGLDLRFIPSLDSIRCLQDKLHQKKLLKKLGILSSEYLEVDASVEDCMNALKHFGGDAVLKWARLGYDGKGTFFLSANSDLKQLELFLEEARKKYVDLFAERKINFVRELAIQSAHSTSGDLVHYPLVISQQDRGVCRTVTGPAVKLGVSKSLETEAKAAMTAIAKALPIYGVFAAEFFEGVDGRLYVNELAPRVHNSGHYSLVGAVSSQFENHIRAVMGEDLGSVEASPFFAMVNLLGPFELKGKIAAVAPKTPSGFSLYWYGKSEVRRGRKMGHLAAKFQSETDFQKGLEIMNQYEQDWSRSIIEKDVG